MSSRTFGSKGVLAYIMQENSDIPDDRDDPLTVNSNYGASGSMLEELINRLPHAGPIFLHDNKTVFTMMSKAFSGTIKS